MSSELVEKRFSHHAPDEAAASLHTYIRAETKDLAYDFEVHLPESREKALALTKLEEALMWANAAIARN